MRPRDDKKRDAILAAALAEVAANGLPSLSIDPIAKRAKVAAGTVYVYFSGKESLIEAVYSAVKSRFAATLAHDEADGAPVRVAFERTCRAYFTYCTEHRNELAFLEQVELLPQYKHRVEALDQAAITPLVALLERGQTERVVKPVPAALLVAYLAGALRFAARAIAGETKAARAHVTTQLLAVCWDAIAA